MLSDNIVVNESASNELFGVYGKLEHRERSDDINNKISNFKQHEIFKTAVRARLRFTLYIILVIKMYGSQFPIE